MNEPDTSSEARYTIRRRGGQTWCEACDEAHDLERDPAGYVLWFTIAVARQHGLTHCGQCGRPVIPIEQSTAG